MALEPADRTKLREYLEEHFNLSELKNLAFDLGVNFQLFYHETLSDFSRELLAYCERRDMLGSLILAVMRRRPHSGFEQLLTKLPTCLYSKKVQIIVYDENVLESASKLLEELALKLDVPVTEIELVGMASGSVRFLISLQEGLADLHVLSKIRLGDGKYKDVDFALFNSLDQVSQKAWRLIACNHPPSHHGDTLHPAAMWQESLEAATARRNPYIVGPPVYSQDFYGRQVLVQDLLDERYSCIYLIGNRRIGKTSLLHHLEQQAGCITLFLDLQATGGDPWGMKRQLEHQVKRKARENPLLQDVGFDENGDICDAVTTLAEVAAANETMILLLWDEAEKLLDLGTDRLECLVGTLRDRRFFRTLLTATKGLSTLNDRYRSMGELPFLFGFRIVYLPPLSDQDAAELICQVHNPAGCVQVTAEIQSRIIELTGNHPYLIQMLCERLFDGGQLHPITERDLVIDHKLAVPFQLDYDGLSSNERAILRWLSERDVAHEDEMYSALGAIDIDNLRSYLMGLEQLGHIRYQNGGYRIANHFLRVWLKMARFQETPVLVSNQASLEVLSNYRWQALKERRAALLEEYKAANAQLIRALSDVERVRIQRQVTDLERQIQAIGNELSQGTTHASP